MGVDYVGGIVVKLTPSSDVAGNPRVVGSTTVPAVAFMPMWFFDIPITGGRMSRGTKRPLHDTFSWVDRIDELQWRPVTSSKLFVPLPKTYGPWGVHYAVDRPEEVTFYTREPHAPAAIDVIPHVWSLPHGREWRSSHPLAGDRLTRYPTALAAMAQKDAELLAAGYVLEGQVHASPLVPGHRAYPQGYARPARAQERSTWES